ncbi:HEAT repeat domain-containing protein [Bacteriovorax sp. DB6_IX]|uniref:HEAT repeat domain-containing protein n=1 Tax=Bacteriovorax sp. DB6_IX TaxID=1353530 RepID=UPI00038A46EE|nr:HEAT repeat domain-containing protein [Bacteriovorax sp. DB6_IX]EQC52671.1 HEAT repeat protein [Bacteriovorax sp. DB6_IX]
MSENGKNTPQGASGNAKFDKKLLENPFVGSLVVPVAIVLVGALIIFGVTKMLSDDHSYKDLVREMKSKTFGNKWVAALELSKIIASGNIPQEDIPWLIENLTDTYNNTIDHRTRDFVIVAVGALRNERGLKLLSQALNDKDKNVRFHAVVALGNMPKSIVFDWTPVINLLESEDYGMVQAATLVLATHKVAAAQEKIIKLLNSELGYGVRYAAATALIQFQYDGAVPTINEILLLEQTSLNGKLTVDEIRGLKFNVLNAAQESKWHGLSASIEKMLSKEKDIKVVARGKEVLNLLKK